LVPTFPFGQHYQHRRGLGSFKDNNAFYYRDLVCRFYCRARVALGDTSTARQSSENLLWTRNFWRDLSLALLLAGVLGNLTRPFTYGT